MNMKIMSFQMDAWQFLSRGFFGQIPQASGRFSVTKPNSNSTMTFVCEIIPKPFDMAFASIIGRNPSIGGFEYFDEDHDLSMTHRWPQAIHMKIDVNLELPEADFKEGELSDSYLSGVMLEARDCFFRLFKRENILLNGDQFSVGRSYRRTYFGTPSLDIVGQRRPNPSEFYSLTEPGEFLGPGLISAQFGGTVREFVWSHLIPFPRATDVTTDLPRIKAIAAEMRMHQRGYKEFSDAHNDLKATDSRAVKNSVRAAAAGINAVLEFYCKLHGKSFPAGGLPFDDKIEKILADTGMPSYKSINATELKEILFLYRARNSQHEADCSFNDGSKTVAVDHAMAKRFIEVAERFSVWMDSLA